MGGRNRLTIAGAVLVMAVLALKGCSQGDREDSAPNTPSSYSNSAENIPILQEARSYSTKSIISFEQVQGQSQWIDSAQRRILGARWTFRPDGTFSFAPSDSRTDLFPLSGRFSCSSASCNFSAASASQAGETGTASASIEGKIDFSGAEPILEMSQVTSMGNAAVVNDTKFAQASGTSYRFTVALE